MASSSPQTVTFRPTVPHAVRVGFAVGPEAEAHAFEIPHSGLTLDADDPLCARLGRLADDGFPITSQPPGNSGDAPGQSKDKPTKPKES